MKKTLVILIALLTLNFSYSQDKQASLIVKKTADWCPFCGTYGWTFFRKVKDDTKDLPSIMIAMHYSGGLMNKTAEELNGNFSGPGQPVFFNNGRDMIVTSQNVDAKAKEYTDSVKVRASRKELVKIELKIVPKGTQFTAQLEIENESALTNAQQTVSLFVLRDNLIFNQASVGPNASHTNVLSGSLTPTTFGVPVYTGNVAAKTKIKINQDFPAITLHNGKPEDVKIAAILWNKNAQGKYDFINGTVLPYSQISTSVQNLANNQLFDVLQKGDQLHIQKEKPGIVSVFDLKGQVILTDFYDQNEVNIQLNEFLNGWYLVQLRNNEGIATERIVIQK